MKDLTRARLRQAARWQAVIADLESIKAQVAAARSRADVRAVEKELTYYRANGVIGVYFSTNTVPAEYFRGPDDLSGTAMAVLEEIESRLSALKEELAPAPRKAVEGFVYLVRCDGCVKIGKAKNLDTRIGQFKTMWLKPVELLAAARVVDPSYLEASLHREYADKRVRGEWFLLTDDDIDAVKAVLS